MKKTILKERHQLLFPILFTAILLPAFASAHSTDCDTAVVKKISGNKNHNLYSGKDKQTIYFSAKLKQKKVYRFYMFNMDGNLVAENDIVNKRGVAFTNMQSGDYYFEIFDKDERVESGTITIK
jgi:hypothetical protein